MSRVVTLNPRGQHSTTAGHAAAADPFSYSGKLATLRHLCVDPRLHRSTIAVASVLIDYADRTTGVAYPSIARIVAESGVPKTTALRGLRQLQDCGWLMTERRVGANNRYTLTSPNAGTGAACGTGSIQDTTSANQNLRTGSSRPERDTKAVPAMAPDQENIQATDINQGRRGGADRFDEFWTAYPKKVGKANAIAVWQRKRLSQRADAIIDDVRASTAAGGRWVNLDARYIKDPERYLKGEHWNDEWSISVSQPTGVLPRDCRSEDELAVANGLALQRFSQEARA